MNFLEVLMGWEVRRSGVKVHLNRVVQKKASCMFLIEMFVQRLNRITVFLFFN